MEVKTESGDTRFNNHGGDDCELVGADGLFGGSFFGVRSPLIHLSTGFCLYGGANGFDLVDCALFSLATLYQSTLPAPNVINASTKQTTMPEYFIMVWLPLKVG